MKQYNIIHQKTFPPFPLIGKKNLVEVCLKCPFGHESKISREFNEDSLVDFYWLNVLCPSCNYQGGLNFNTSDLDDVTIKTQEPKKDVREIKANKAIMFNLPISYILKKILSKKIN